MPFDDVDRGDSFRCASMRRPATGIHAAIVLPIRDGLTAAQDAEERRARPNLSIAAHAASGVLDANERNANKPRRTGGAGEINERWPNIVRRHHLREGGLPSFASKPSRRWHDALEERSCSLSCSIGLKRRYHPPCTIDRLSYFKRRSSRCH